MKRISIISTAVVLMLIMGMANAQPRMRGMDRGPERGMRMNFHAMLNLTDEQEAQIEKLRLEQQKEMIPLRDKMQALQGEYRLMVVDDSKSKVQLKKQLQKISEVREEMQLKMAEHHKAVRALLTDEQKVKFDAHFLAKKGQRGGHGGRQGRGFGPQGPRPGCPMNQ